MLLREVLTPRVRVLGARRDQVLRLRVALGARRALPVVGGGRIFGHVLVVFTDRELLAVAVVGGGARARLVLVRACVLKATKV